MQDLFSFAIEHITLISAWFFCLVVLIFYFTKNIFLTSKIINNIQAINLINQRKAIIIDTRNAEIFQKGHILNSINIPLEKIFLGKLNEIQAYKMLPIILVLNNTYKYHHCIKTMLKYGFNNVYILKNGLHDWNVDHLPLFITDINHSKEINKK